MKFSHFFIIAAAITALLSSTAYADVEQRLDVLEKNITTLQRQVFKGGSSGKGSSAAVGGNSEELSEQVRELRGEIEKIQHNQKSLEEQMAKFTADLEYKVKQLEKKSEDRSTTDQHLSDIDRQLDNKFVAGTGKDDQANIPGSGGGQLVTPSDKSQEIEAEYQAAYDALKAKRFDKSKELFQEFVKKYPNHGLTSIAFYWLGESYYESKNYDQSALAYLKGYQNNTKGMRAADSLLKLAKSLSELNKHKEACITITKLQKEFPNATAGIKKQAELEKKKLLCE
jgi:tol-pal system protein YbgF